VLIKVIIVDDEITIREGIKRAMDWKHHGMEISAVAGSGTEALDFMEQSPPDIVILDIMLNDIDGLEVLDIIRHKYPNIYVIIISGYDDFEYAQRAIELNAFCYLLKPLDLNQLSNKLLQISAAIKQRFDKLKKDKELNERLKESIPIIRDNFFCEIVSGKCISMDSIAAKADFLEIDLKAQQYSVVVIELHSLDNINEYDKNLIKYAAMEICRDAFFETHKCYPFNVEDNIGLLICADETEYKNIREICLSIKEKVNSKLGIPLTIGIGKPCPDLFSIQYSFKEAVDALEYKILMGLNRIIDSDIIYKSSNRRFERNSVKELFDKRADELKLALKTNNRICVDNFTSDIISALRDSISNNIKNYSRDLLLLSIYLSEAAIDLDVNIDYVFHEGDELFGTFKRLETIESISECMESFFRKVMGDLKDKQKDSNSSYINKAMNCIKENLNGEISLTTVADALYVSSNYLSRIFKQEVGESFIEYIIREKMNEAKRLLETSSQKVYEIANVLNYKDVNFFSKTFKRNFGVTPSEYRELL